MKIKRFHAENMRQANRLVRESLGADAVILSNRRTDHGVEIVAAMDYDETTVEQALADLDSEHTPIPTLTPSAANPIGKTVMDHASSGRVQDLDQVLSEMREFRGFVSHQINGLAWASYQGKCPVNARLLNRMIDVGLEAALSERLLGSIGEANVHDTDERHLTTLLAKCLPMTEDDVLMRGGRLAFVGPTGVGKTTTVAKIAARYTLAHGSGRVGIVTTDSLRIGSFDQLRTFARILKVPVRVTNRASDLEAALDAFADLDLVLVDTGGTSPRDMRFAEQFTMLRDGGGDLEVYLVVAANAQSTALRDTFDGFAKVGIEGCVLTKLDEARRLGGVLSLLVETGVPVAFASEGQRVPEDLAKVTAAYLVDLAWRLADEFPRSVDRQVLATTFGPRVVNGHI